MEYMLLIYEDEARWASMSEDESNAVTGEYVAYTNELRASGAFVGGNALHPTSTATTVRVRDGETLATDGPFAETKEALGGYYTVDVESLDEAVEWAAKIPSARRGLGIVEVRPVVVFPATAEAGA